MSTACRSHRWTLLEANAVGYFSKRDDGQTNDIEPFCGTVFSCRRCARLEMENKKLQRVQVFRATDREKELFWRAIDRRVTDRMSLPVCA